MLRAGIKEQILNSALKGYTEAGGAHLPIDTDLLSQAAKKQLDFATRYNTSGDELMPVRSAMYAREAAHVGFVAGQQTAMRERGAKRWRRILHAELSKTGPCPECTADAELTHPIDEVFWEPHPGGYCGVQGVSYQMEGHEPIELPVPGEANPSSWEKAVKGLFERIQHVVRRIRL